LLLAAGGAAVGLPLAIWGLRLLISLSPSDFPRLNEINIDLRVLAFTLIAAALCGLIFGLSPALQSSRINLNETLKEGGRSGADHATGRRLRNALVIAEVAFSLMLLVGAGLMIKSFLTLQSVSPGFNPDHILTMHLTLPGAKYNTDEKVNLYNRQLLERVTALPGVEE